MTASIVNRMAALHIERSHLKIWRRFTRLYAARSRSEKSAFASIGGGYALITNSGSRFVPKIDNHLCNTITTRDLEDLEERCRGRSASISIELCSASLPGLSLLLQAWRYDLISATDVMVHFPPLGQAYDSLNTFRVRCAAPFELHAWARTLAQGFEPPNVELSTAFLVSCGKSPSSVPLLAVDALGNYAGGGLLVYYRNTAWLLGFSTLPRVRRRGVQKAVLKAALNYANAANVHIAAAEAASETASHRNFTRCGFFVLHQRLEFFKCL